MDGSWKMEEDRMTNNTVDVMPTHRQHGINSETVRAARLPVRVYCMWLMHTAFLPLPGFSRSSRDTSLTVEENDDFSSADGNPDGKREKALTVTTYCMYVHALSELGHCSLLSMLCHSASWLLSLSLDRSIDAPSEMAILVNRYEAIKPKSTCSCRYVLCCRNGGGGGCVCVCVCVYVVWSLLVKKKTMHFPLAKAAVAGWGVTVSRMKGSPDAACSLRYSSVCVTLCLFAAPLESCPDIFPSRKW